METNKSDRTYFEYVKLIKEVNGSTSMIVKDPKSGRLAKLVAAMPDWVNGTFIDPNDPLRIYSDNIAFDIKTPLPTDNNSEVSKLVVEKCKDDGSILWTAYGFKGIEPYDQNSCKTDNR